MGSPSRGTGEAEPGATLRHDSSLQCPARVREVRVLELRCPLSGPRALKAVCVSAALGRGATREATQQDADDAWVLVRCRALRRLSLVPALRLHGHHGRALAAVSPPFLSPSLFVGPVGLSSLVLPRAFHLGLDSKLPSSYASSVASKWPFQMHLVTTPIMLDRGCRVENETTL